MLQLFCPTCGTFLFCKSSCEDISGIETEQRKAPFFFVVCASDFPFVFVHVCVLFFYS